MDAEVLACLQTLGKRLGEWQAHQHGCMEAALEEHRRLEACLQAFSTTSHVESAAAPSPLAVRLISQEVQTDEDVSHAARSRGTTVRTSFASLDSNAFAPQSQCALSSSLTRDLRSTWTDKFAERMTLILQKSGSKSEDAPMIRQIVTSPKYEMALMAVICLNTVFIGAQVQGAAQMLPSNAYKEPHIMTMLELAFFVLFAADIFLQLGAFGCSMYWSKQALWHIVDTVVVVVMCLEMVEKHFLASDSPFKNATMLRTLRAVRIIRAVRMLRLMRFREGLRVLMHMVMASLKAMVWAGLVILGLAYVFGVLFTQGLLDFCTSRGGCDELADQGLLHRFGGIDVSLFSLYLAMTNGTSWETIFNILKPLPDFYSFLFISYVGIAYYAIANLVTGIFVETVVHVGGKDREGIVADELKKKKDFMENITRVFAEMDTDHSGDITLQEIRDTLSDQRLLAYFNALELDISDVTTLFKLLDRDKTGSIDLGEFLQGCMRLRGEAKTFDLAKLQYQGEWMMHNINLLRHDLHDSRPSKKKDVPDEGAHMELKFLDSKLEACRV